MIDYIGECRNLILTKDDHEKLAKEKEQMYKSKYFKSARNQLHLSDWSDDRKELVLEMIEQLGEEADDGQVIPYDDKHLYRVRLIRSWLLKLEHIELSEMTDGAIKQSKSYMFRIDYPQFWISFAKKRILYQKDG